MPTYRLPVDISYPGGGSPGVNVWHFRDAGTGLGNANLQTAVADLQEFYAHLQSILPSVVTVSFAGTATSVLTSSPEYVDGLDTWSMVGTASPAMMPASQALVASWRTSSATRSGRGRTFIGPLSLQFTDGTGHPDTTSRAVLRTAIDDLIDGQDGPGRGAFGVLSTTQNVIRDFVSGSVGTTYAVLRSRRD